MKIAKGRIPKTWDDQIVYDAAKKYIKNLLNEQKERCYSEDLSRAACKDYFALACAYTQLMNGCRISEAIEALYWFSVTGQREVWVRVRKRKDGKQRKVIIPNEIDKNIIDVVAEWFYEKNRKRCVYNRLKYKFLNTNTHSFRYAFITYLCIDLGLPAQIVSKITQHKSLEVFNRYIEEVAAMRKFEEVFKKILEGDNNE